jgi:hypothetical protein
MVATKDVEKWLSKLLNKVIESSKTQLLAAEPFEDNFNNNESGLVIRFPERNDFVIRITNLMDRR